MSVWVELRCDVRSGVRGKKCLSGMNIGPMGLFSTTNVLKQIANLEKEGLEKGWKRTTHGLMICPSCRLDR